MSLQPPSEGRATLARSYRNLSEREIRAKLEGPLSDAERVTAKAELLRRGAGDDSPDTALASIFAPTSVPDAESSSEADGAGSTSGEAAARGRASPWPWIVTLLVLVLLALAWTMRARFIHGA
jgi:hypothetical protein